MENTQKVYFGNTDKAENTKAAYLFRMLWKSLSANSSTEVCRAFWKEYTQGDINEFQYEQHPIPDLTFSLSCLGVPPEILNLRSTEK